MASDEPERPDVASLLPVESFRAPLELIGDRTAVVLAAAEETPAALADHWEDVTTAMHDADARHLYVDVADPLAERAVLTSAGRAEPTMRRPSNEQRATSNCLFRAQTPTSAARTINEAESQLERELRSGYRVVVCFESRGEAERARYNLNRVDARFLGERLHRPGRGGRGAGWCLLFEEAALTRRLRLARAAPRGDPVPPPRPPAAGGGAERRPRADGELRRPARRRLRRPRGPRHRALRRLRDQDPGRGHPRLPRARVPRRGQGLRAHRPARQDHPLRRRRRRGAAALGARLEALGRGQGPRPARRPRARRRAAQPLRRAPGAQGPRVRARRRVAARARALVSLPRDRRPDRRDRGGQGATWSPSARWTG